MIERWEPVWRTFLPRMHYNRSSGKRSPTLAWASEPCLSLLLSLVWGLCWLCPALPSALPAVVFPVVRRANWVNHCDLADIHWELRSARLILCVSRAKISTWWKAVEFISQSVAQTLPFLSPTAWVPRRLLNAPNYAIFAYLPTPVCSADPGWSPSLALATSSLLEWGNPRGPGCAPTCERRIQKGDPFFWPWTWALKSIFRLGWGYS